MLSSDEQDYDAGDEGLDEDYLSFHATLAADESDNQTDYEDECADQLLATEIDECLAEHEDDIFETDEEQQLRKRNVLHLRDFSENDVQ